MVAWGVVICEGFRLMTGGQGRGRTVDLPIFSRTLVPTELPGRVVPDENTECRRWHSGRMLHLAANRWRDALLATAAVVALVLWAVEPAAAHATLISMSPADGALLQQPPTRVVLTFDQPIQNVGDAVVVRDPSGNSVSAGAPVVLDNTVTESLAPITVAGTYTVAYRVVAPDGHPVEAQLSFSYLTRSVPASQPTSPSAANDSNLSPTTVYLVAVVAAAVIIALGVAVISRRESKQSGEDSSPD